MLIPSTFCDEFHRGQNLSCESHTESLDSFKWGKEKPKYYLYRITYLKSDNLGVPVLICAIQCPSPRILHLDFLPLSPRVLVARADRFLRATSTDRLLTNSRDILTGAARTAALKGRFSISLNTFRL